MSDTVLVDNYLSTSFLGCGSAATMNVNGETRIFYQAPDGKLHMLKGNGTPGPENPYRIIDINTGTNPPQTNTPLATIFWWDAKGPGFISRLYYIGFNNQLHELNADSTDSFTPGALDCLNIFTAPNSGILYTAQAERLHLRVGFQSASDPKRITEAEFRLDTGWRLNPVLGAGPAVSCSVCRR